MAFTVIQVLEAAYELPPDNTNPRIHDRGAACAHWDNDGNPSCIAGQIVYKLSPRLFGDWQQGGESYNGMFLAVPGVHEEFTPDAINLIAGMQRYADAQVDHTWGEAIREAVRWELGVRNG